MGNSRLSMALGRGLFELPAEGPVGLFRPPVQLDVQLFGDANVRIVHGFAPEVAHFEATGLQVTPDAKGPFEVSIVFLPRSKLLAKKMIAQAARLTTDQAVVVDGAKTDGVDGILRALKKAGGQVGEVISKSHGKIFRVQGADLSGWDTDELVLPDGHVTKAGTFSADAVDRASELLGAHIGDLSGRVADLGAGWGYLAGKVLESDAVTACHLIEAEYDALDAAKTNLHDARARFHWADATQFEAASGFDHIVTNPPFHTDRKADPTLGRAFIQAAARLLSPRGKVWLVANRHLPYEACLRDLFCDVVELGDDRSFKIFRASGPRKAKS